MLAYMHTYTAHTTQTITQTVGVDTHGNKVKSPQKQALRAMGQKWALHILEAPFAWLLSSAYIYATVCMNVYVYIYIYCI